MTRTRIAATALLALALAGCGAREEPPPPPPPTPFLEVDPVTAALETGEQLLLTADVPIEDGAPFYAVAWSTTDGAIEATGEHGLSALYTAPASAGTAVITVTLGSDPPLVETAVVTVSAPPEPVTLVAVGDIACPPSDPNFNGGLGQDDLCMQARTAAAAVALDPDAVIVLGDLQYNAGSYADFMDSYDLSWGQLNDVVHPIPGGHEYETGDADGYFRYFDEQGVWDALPPGAGDPARGYYAFNLGEWRVLALNANCDEVVGGCDEGSEQHDWFVAELAAAGARCTLVAMHVPRFNAGENGDSPEVADLFEAAYEAGVDLVLAGDEHSYERSAPVDPTGAADPAGVRLIIAGTGGRSLYVHAGTYPTSEKQIDGEYGVLHLELYPDSYEFEFVPAEGYEGEDSGSFECG